MKTISLIAALDTNSGIGFQGKIQWRLPIDMQHFKATTDGAIVAMGRKTWESLPPKFRPLPNRMNVVLSRSVVIPDVKTCDTATLLHWFEGSQPIQDLFIIGGGEIYSQMLPHASKLYLTKVHSEFPADTFFPTVPGEFELTTSEDYHGVEGHSHNFTIETWDRIA